MWRPNRNVMKIISRIFVVLLAIFTISSAASAQSYAQDEMIKRRAAEKVGQMNDYISFMGSKKKKIENRRYYKDKALKLFIGKGYDYEENDVIKEGVMMEITSLNRKPIHKLIRTYFNNLVNLSYSDVRITSTEIADIKVSNLQQIDNNLYVCTCQFDQAFVGYRDGRPVYQDITTKRVKCYVYAEDTEDGFEYVILLGDVTALETKPVK